MQLKSIIKYPIILAMIGTTLFNRNDLLANEFNTRGFALINSERFKPIPDIASPNALTTTNDNSSQTDQLQVFGVHFNYCHQIACHVKKDKPDPPETIKPINNATAKKTSMLANIDFALLFQMGQFRSKRNDRTNEKENTNSVEFLPGDNLYIGAQSDFGEFFLTHLDIGRFYQNNFALDQIHGGHGPLSGLRLKLKSPEYGKLQFLVHRPDLSGSYTNEDHFKNTMSYQNDFLKVAKSARSIAQKTQYDIAFTHLSFGVHYEVMQFSKEKEQNMEQYSIDNIHYLGAGFAIDSGDLDDWRTEFYLGIDRNETQTQSQIRNDQNKYESNTKSHALRSGFSLDYKKKFGFGLQFFLPQSRQTTKGSQTESIIRGGYTGYGNNPASTHLLTDSLDMLPWYQICKHDSCGSIEYAHTEPGMRQPSAVLNATISYNGEKYSSSLTGSFMYPLAASDQSGWNPFSHLKKDETQYQYKEGQFIFSSKIENDGKLIFRYNRLYRIRPDRRTQSHYPKKHSSLAAEGFALEYQLSF